MKGQVVSDTHQAPSRCLLLLSQLGKYKKNNEKRQIYNQDIISNHLWIVTNG